MRTAIAIALIVLALAACGETQKPPGCDDTCKRNQIALLWTQIRGWRHDAHMDLEPTNATLIQMRPFTVPQAKAVCPEPHEIPPKCDDICDLSTAICDNAEAICGIAGELGPQDSWAQEKCASAKASCREAKQRCCNCSKAPPEGP